MADLHINKGIGVVFGLSTGQIGTGTAYLMPVEQDFTKTRQSIQHHEPISAAVIGETYFQKESTQRLRLYPAGASNADAKTANNTVIDPGDEIVIVDTNDPELAGNYTMTEVGKQGRNADKKYWDLSIRKHGNGLVGVSGVFISHTVT